MSSNGNSSSGSGGAVDPLQRTLLVAICQHLDESQNRRDLLRICASWSRAEKLPIPIALGEARALLDLRLMDLAWVRLRELDRTSRHWVEVQSLTAEMFIERGWPGRAFRILEKAAEEYPERADLRALLERARQPPLRPPSESRKIERDGSESERLDLAERLLCAGSQLRARSILKRLARGKTQPSRRADELLWALETDLEAEELPLMQLAKQFSAELPLLDSAPLEQALEGLTSAEVTTRAPHPEALLEEKDPRFPSLFRWVDDSVDFSEDSQEVTRVSSLSTLRSSAAVTDAGQSDWASEENDTKVVRVLHRDAKGTPTLIEDLDSIEESLEEGFSPVPNDVHTTSFSLSEMDFETDSEFLEEEDAGLIVMTRREATDQIEGGVVEKSINLVEASRTQPEAHTDFEATDPTVPFVELEEDVPQPVVVAARTPPQRVRSGVRRKKQKKQQQKRVLLVFCVMLTAFVLGMMGWRHFQEVKQEEVFAEILEVIATGDQALLEAEELRLDQMGQGRTGADDAGHALIKMILWGDYDAGIDRREEADALMKEALKVVNMRTVKLLTAFDSYYKGAYADALARLEGQVAGFPEAQLLHAKIEFQQGEYSRALSTVNALQKDEPGHRAAAILKAELCLRLDRAACANDALLLLGKTQSSDPSIAFLSKRVEEMSKDLSLRATALAQILEDGLALPQRQASLSHLVIADLYLRAGDKVSAERELNRALSLDPRNAAARISRAVESLGTGKIKKAYENFDRCISALPKRELCHLGKVYALLELDRVTEAQTYLRKNEKAFPDEHRFSLLKAWVAYMAGVEKPSMVLNHLRGESPQEKFLRGLVMGKQNESGDPKESLLSESVLIEAAEGLVKSPSPIDQWLAPRANAAAARFGHTEHRSTQAQEALQLGGSDPMVLVDLGWYKHSIGESEDAVQLFDKVDQLGLMSARAQYERGQFFRDSKAGPSRTIASWNRYLAMRPTGQRAEYVEKSIQAIRY